MDRGTSKGIMRFTRQRVLIPIAGFALLNAAWGGEPDAPWRPGISSRIELLKKQIESEGSGTTSPFWDEIQAQSTPLVKPLPGDTNNGLLTFVSRTPTTTQNTTPPTQPSPDPTP